MPGTENNSSYERVSRINNINWGMEVGEYVAQAVTPATPLAICSTIVVVGGGVTICSNLLI